jgi:hypothetical protein
LIDCESGQAAVEAFPAQHRQPWLDGLEVCFARFLPVIPHKAPCVLYEWWRR